MNLLTANIIQALPPIESTRHIPREDKTIICKFYISGGWSWYVFEGEVDTQKGYKFFGMMVYKEENFNHTCMGYFYLSDLLVLNEQDHNVQLDESVFKASYDDVLREVVAITHPFYRHFLIEKIFRALPPIRSTEHIPLEERILICGFHMLSGLNWYVFEGEFTVEHGYRFFGIIDIEEREWGYFHLSELLEIHSADDPISVSYSPAFNVRYSDVFGVREEEV
jgi:hypothetical protein